MKLGPTNSRGSALGSPFSRMMQGNAEKNKEVLTGPGIGLNRAVPGLGKPASSKRVRPFAQALGDTPQRDGPFAESATAVYHHFPPKSRQRRSKQHGGSGAAKTNKPNPFQG